MFSRNELIIMIGVVSVLLVCISILTVIDIIEHIKNKHRNISMLEEQEDKEEFEEKKEPIEVYEEIPNEILVSDIKEEMLEPIKKKQDVEVETLTIENTPIKEEVLEISEPVKQEEIFEVMEPVKKDEVLEISQPAEEETLSVQVNEVKEKIDLQEELNKATVMPSLEDTITNFEMEQERTAIISLDELMNRSDELYDSNEIVQYDDGNEPITIDEVINRFNDNKKEINAVNEVKEVPKVMESVIEEKPKKELYSHKESVPFISSIYGLEPNNQDLTFENTATYEKLDRSKSNEFMNRLREMSENKLNH